MRRLRRVLILLALAYVGYGVLMVQAHRALVYPFHDQRRLVLDGFEEVTLAGEDAATVYRHQGADGAPVVIYFMGNTGAVVQFGAMLRHHAAAGRSVVAMGYRGGGGLPGQPTEALLKSDALAVIDQLDSLVPGHGAVVAQGYSMGSGLASWVAAERTLDGLLLVAPYARMCELMVPRSWLPACQMPGVDGWKSLDLTSRIDEPTLILHGERDSLIPFSHGVRMAEAIPDARLVAIETGAHDDLFEKPGYLSSIDAFIDGLAK